jgi:hypothetical protein
VGAADVRAPLLCISPPPTNNKKNKKKPNNTVLSQGTPRAYLLQKHNFKGKKGSRLQKKSDSLLDQGSLDLY